MHNKQYMQVKDSICFIFVSKIDDDNPEYDDDDDGDNNNCNYISMF